MAAIMGSDLNRDTLNSPSVPSPYADDPGAIWPPIGLNTWAAPGEMHFRLEEPYLGQLDLSCENGYVVQEYDLGSPDIREVSYDNSVDSGSFDITRFHGARSVSLQIALRSSISVNGTGGMIASEAQLRDRLLGYLAPTRRPTLIFTEHQDLRIRQMDLRGSDGSVSFGQPLGNKMAATWVCPYGMVESWMVNTVTATLNEGETLSRVTLENKGNVGTHWQARLSGDVTNPILKYTDPLGVVSRLQINYDSDPGDVILIDSFSKIVTVNGASVGYKFVSPNSKWFRIAPGVSELELDYTGLVRMGYPWLRWQPAPQGPGNWAITPGIGPQTPPNNPPPGGAPPWAWSTLNDPGTGEPGIAQVTIFYRDTWF